MSQSDENARRLLRVLGGLEASGDHEVWLALLPDYLEVELSGDDPAKRFPDLHAHLDRCEACGLVYAEMLDLALAQEAGKLPEVTNFPPVRLPQPVRQADLVRRVAEATLDALQKSRRDLDGAIRRFFELLATATGPLEPAAMAQAFGLGQADTPAMPLVVAGYYALEAVIRQVGTSDLSSAEARSQLQAQLEIAAQAEARRVKLNPAELTAFVSTFVRLALDELSQSLD